jgi:hypothetical protein
MHASFPATVWTWRGPSPFHFVTVPDEVSDEILELSPTLSYGWGMIPARARIGGTEWTTSLFRRDGAYVVPLKDKVRRAERIDVGGTVTVHLHVGP